MGVPLAEKTKLEVFGKGPGEEPFFRKVCPSNKCKASIWVSGINCPEFFVKNAQSAE